VEDTVAVEVVLDKALDKAYEGKPLGEILDAPVAALAGVSDGDAAKLKEAFGIVTVRDLGTNKYFAVAGVLAAMEKHAG
jgi:hypothetical protein